MNQIKRCMVVLLALFVVLSMSVVAYADRADFAYKLILTDQDGRTVSNPRALPVGATLTVEIELTRTDTTAASYDTYGFEFRLLSRGLQYNNDGASFSNNTKITLQAYETGDSVGFAYYDMEQKGERIGNPVIAGKWSYTVTDPSAVNITVPVALLYIVNDSEAYEPIGNATLYLDPNGGTIIGEDVSGEHKSGTIITLPDVEFLDYVFLGWSDGANLYPAGSYYTVTGIVTLTAQWENLVRNRQISFDPNGGQIVGDDPSGYYADGEKIVFPEAEREGYTLISWSDGNAEYAPGEEYAVDNSKIFTAQWEPYVKPTEPSDEVEEKPKTGWFRNDDGTLNVARVAAVSGGGGGAATLGVWQLLLLWKRRRVRYSLCNGDVSLFFKNKVATANVEVVLYDKNVAYHLNQSGQLRANQKLEFIEGNEESFAIADVKPGKYKGKLIVREAGRTREVKCRIKVQDQEIRTTKKQ